MISNFFFLWPERLHISSSGYERIYLGKKALKISKSMNHLSEVYEVEI